VFGNVKLDLREAVLAGPEVDIEAKAVFGSVEVIVPEGVLVELSGGGALSSQELKVQGDAPEGAPVIRIHHRGVCGSLGVRSRPRLADQLKDSARALVERFQQPRE
jgi:Cell wall-active antibiotics response 4TMS YvqF